MEVDVITISKLCTLIMVFMCMAGITGNTFSLIIYLKPAFRKKSINILLCALSASDLCVCCLAIPVFSLAHLQELMPVSDRVTALIMVYLYPITVMIQVMSVWLLVSITIDRYLAVCHPFVVRSYCTRTRAMATVLSIVIFSIVYNFVRFWEFQYVDVTEGVLEDRVQPLLRDNTKFMLWYQNIATSLSQFVLPFAVLSVLNVQVARTIIRASAARSELVASEKREHRTAKMMLYVVVVFLFCYTFSFILNVVEMFHGELFRSEIGYLLNDVNNILVVVNSSSTFLFYYTYSTRYRMQLRNLCCLRWACSRVKFNNKRTSDAQRLKNGISSTSIKQSCYSSVNGSYLHPPSTGTSYQACNNLNIEV